MKNTQNIASLIAQLEYEVGRECYNPNSYDGHTMKYVFGSNHLFIGKGIYNILNELEKRYGLDFNKMEEEFEKEDKN